MEVQEEDVVDLKKNISKVQNVIKLNPDSYDSHVELIKLLSDLYAIYQSEAKLTGLDPSGVCNVWSQNISVTFKKLRNSRQYMSSLFPLTAQLWLKWIEDEINAGSQLIDHEIIENIFKKATADYLSVEIWCQYADYLIMRQQTSTTITVDYIRDIFEKAVTSCGLHYSDGHKIWDCYQKFELKLLLKAEKQAQDNNTNESIQHLKLQLSNLVKLYRRELSIPLKEHYDLLDLFTKELENRIVVLNALSVETASLINMDEITNIYNHTSSIIESKSIGINEQYLEEHNYSFESYNSYITYELDAGVNDPARIQCLFERAIVHHCLTPSIWVDYIDFLNGIIKLPDLVISVCKRALRNVTWDSCLYMKYALILEQESYSAEDIREVYETSLQKLSSNAFNYCNMIISYLSFEKRICESEESILKVKPRVYQLLQRALRQLEILEDADKCIVDFVLFWIDIQRFWFKDDKAKDIWMYMTSKHKILWYSAVMFGRTLNDKVFLNDIFHIMLFKFPDAVENFSQSWLNCESVFGTLSSQNQLMKKINLYLPSHVQVRQTKEIQSLLSKTEHKTKYLKSWLRSAEEKLFSLKIAEPNKTKQIQKKIDLKLFETAKNENKVYKIHVDSDETYQKAAEVAKKERNTIGPVMPPGFLPNNNNDEDGIEESEKVDSFSQSCTVYVSNLHPSVNVEQLKSVFSQAGNVENVDLHKHKGGKIFAFVAYTSEEEARKALELEHVPLMNRPLYVSEYKHVKNKEKPTDGGSSQYSQSQERNKLFVSNLAKSTTQIDLEKLFNQYGDMSSLRLINKKGSPKSFAYVEYETEEAANRYRKAISNTILRGQLITVEFSNPSMANQGRAKPVPTSSSLPAKRKSGVDIGHQVPAKVFHKESSSDDAVFVRPKPASFGLVPPQARSRNQQLVNQSSKKVRISVPAGSNEQSNSDENKRETVTSVDAQSSSTAVSSARKSNDDFRKMFFKS